jgi:hypothetical protein
VNFKLKQRMKFFGAMVTLGMDYISDIGKWRSYCSIEDTLVRGIISLIFNDDSLAHTHTHSLSQVVSVCEAQSWVGLNLGC